MDTKGIAGHGKNISMPTNKENSDEYVERLKHFNRLNLKKTRGIPSIGDLIKEGDRILEEEASKKTELPKSVLPSSHGNPYVKAKEEILNRWRKSPKSAWKVQEVKNMEDGLKPKDRFYDDFVKEIISLAESFPSNN